MSRAIQISVPADRTARILEQLDGREGIVSIGLQKGASVKPAGDVLTVQATSAVFGEVVRGLARVIGEDGSIVTSEPQSLISPSIQKQIDQETNEASWPEMGALLRRDTNVTSNYLMAMFFSGVIAAAGLWTDTLHIVVGAMVVAPGFEPIIRIPFGLLAQHGRSWRQGLVSTVIGYGVLILGAAAATWFGMLTDSSPEKDLATQTWISFWTSLSPMSLVVSLAAAAAGAAIIAAQRSTLTAGVMIALALIPSASIIGLGLASGEFGLAWEGVLRWAIDVGCVLLGGGAVFLVKRMTLEGKPATAVQQAQGDPSTLVRSSVGR